jgi:hypothetical protein
MRKGKAETRKWTAFMAHDGLIISGQLMQLLGHELHPPPPKKEDINGVTERHFFGYRIPGSTTDYRLLYTGGSSFVST